MAATITGTISSMDSQPPISKHNAHNVDVEVVRCACCGMTEECTLAYIAGVRERYGGRWICGLCAEAVKEESQRSMDITTDEAMKMHMKFCEQFRSSSPRMNPAEDLINAAKWVLRRSLDSPRKVRSADKKASPDRSCQEQNMIEKVSFRATKNSR